MVQNPPKKGLFLGGGVWRLKVEGFGVCLGPICIRGNKLKGDPAPEVEGPDFLSFLIAFPKKKFVLGKTK